MDRLEVRVGLLMAVAAAALVPLPISALVPALALATVALWVRGKSWASIWSPGRPRALMMIGGLAVGAAVQVGLLWLTGGGGGGDWVGIDQLPPLKGHGEALLTALVLAVLGNGVVASMVFHGYLQRELEDLHAGPYAVLLAGAVFGLSSSGLSLEAVGAGMVGCGLGLLYRAHGDLALPIAVRVGFDSVYLVALALV
jgi:membrane protease YdiL (CAAX protease family)